MVVNSPSFLRFALLLAVSCLGSFASQAQQADGMKPVQNRRRYMFPQKDTECPYVQNVTKNTEEAQEIDGTFTRLAYRPYAELLAEITELKKLHTWADTTYQRRLAALPPGGALLVTIRRKGPGNTNLANLTIAATTKDGKEIFRQTPTAGGGRFHSRDLYQAQRLIPFPKTDPQTLNVSIADAKVFQTFEYTVTVP